MAKKQEVRKKIARSTGNTYAPTGNNGVNIGEYAPAPMIDKNPRVVGSRLTLNEVSAIMRQATYGLRKGYVDMINELLERDASAYAALSQRVLSVASSEIAVRPPKYIRKKYQKRAETIAEWVREKIHQIPELKQSIAQLQWGMFYGITAQEITWRKDREGRHVPVRLNFIHSRRLEYPRDSSWDLYIKDDGDDVMRAVQNAKMRSRAEPWWGTRVADFPGKFIVHAPSIRSDYPTREGLGRQMAIYMALKSMALRSGSQTIERFAKPWAIGYYNTKTEDNPNPRVATTTKPDGDIYKAAEAMEALGTGAMTYAVLPDSVELKPQENLTGSFTAELPQTIFIKYIDQQIARAVLTTDEFTIAAGVGSQAKAEVLKRNLMQVLQWDAAMLAESLRRDLVYYMVAYAFPQDIDLIPEIIIQVQDAPNLEQLVMAAQCAFELGAPIDIQAICDKFNIPITDDPKKQAQPRVDPNEELKAETQKAISKESNKTKKEVAAKSAAKAATTKTAKTPTK